MAQLAIPLILAGTVLTAGSAMRRGEAAKRGADFQAAQLDQAAGQHQAAAQRHALDEARTARYAESRALAVAAASGGGASGRTVTDVIGRIAKEGAYRSSLALYQGDADAQQMRLRADAARYSGKVAKQAGQQQAIATILSGTGRALGAKYGANPPASPSAGSGVSLDTYGDEEDF